MSLLCTHVLVNRPFELDMQLFADVLADAMHRIATTQAVISCVRNVVAADAILFLLIHRFQMSRNYRLRLFAGSLRAGQRGAAVMSLIRSAQLNGHDPYCYLKDVLTRLPTQRADNLAQLLPHLWSPTDLLPEISTLTV